MEKNNDRKLPNLEIDREIANWLNNIIAEDDNDDETIQKALERHCNNVQTS